jgi:hypothetical protein
MIAPSTLGTLAIVLVLIWTFGGLALRLGGALILWVGLAGLATIGNPNALWLVAVGGLAWLGGQGHYMLRHGAAKSPLAQLLFEAVASAWRRLCERLQNGTPPDEPEPDGAALQRRGAERRLG